MIFRMEYTANLERRYTCTVVYIRFYLFYLRALNYLIDGAFIMYELLRRIPDCLARAL